jgi:adenosylmethionine-8-amino-7-oxononanoate aminotransferase
MTDRQDSNIKAAVDAHVLIPAQEMAALGHSKQPVLTHGEGIYVHTEDGTRLIDGPAGMWCAQVGYGRREIVDAMAAQAMALPYASPWYMSTSPAAMLAKKIASLTPGDLNRIFFTTGGSTAVDSALRFSEFYNNVLGRPKKKRIIARLDGYHGSTTLTAACSGRVGNWKNFDIKQDRISFLSSPNPRHAGNRTQAEFLDDLVEEFETRIDTLGADTIAAFLAEPVMASGGVIIPPQGYHARFKQVCEKHDILYISDEVVTAFGRCGEWFASEKVFGVVPDIITFAKGVTSGYVPLGGLAISDRVMARVSGDNAAGSWFSNGYTYTNQPVACATALANIALMEREGIVAHARDITGHFAAGLQSLADLPGVADVRSVGLIGAVQCMLDPSKAEGNDADKAFASEIDKRCFELGLIVRPLADNCVISPALIITRDQIDDIIAIMRRAISEVGAKHGLTEA